jgi:protoporphyrinogen/coproporphyrinogen III oxidase
VKSAIVVGGGISGIAAATRLGEHGYTVQIFEAASILGGRIGTRQHGDVELDLGGRNFSASDEPLFSLFRSFGIDELADYHFNSVHVGDGPHMDMRRGGSVLTRIKRFLNMMTAVGPTNLFRLRRVAESARGEKASLIGTKFWTQLAEDTSDPAAVAYFGPRVADEVLRPWTLRMMGSEPEEVYLGNLGPLLGRKPGTQKRVKGGMGKFLHAARDKLDVHTNHNVRSVSIEEDGRAIVEGTADGRAFREAADLAVIATPSTIAADLLKGNPQLSATLRQIAYRTVATVVAEYESVVFPKGVSGLFLPRGFISNHIAKYDDQGRVRFTFAGVAARKALTSNALTELLDKAESDFARFGGQLGRRVSQLGHIWEPGLCGHSWMHHRTVALINDALSQTPNLVLTGDYFRGNMLGACVVSARENVDRQVGNLTK